MISIFPAEEFVRRRRLFDALGQLYSVDFTGVSEVNQSSGGTAILFDVDRQQAVRVAKSGTRCLAFLKESGTVSLPTENITLASIPYLDRCFRGRTLPDKAVKRAVPLKAEAGDEVVAQSADSILWIHRRQESSAVDLVAMDFPDCGDDGFLFEHFQQEDWIRFLPILHFLREVSGWQPPPLRACFMFDDPNLHWKSYGYVNYEQLVHHASKHNYHASFATVPMDSWHVNRRTADMFQAHQNRISLLIHGNNHTAKELAQTQKDTSRRELAAQALRRIERLEQVSGLEVSRVMAAPHGACSHDMATVLLQMGFEAACITRGSIMYHNPGTAWPISVGLNPAEFLGAGLPVIPRLRLQSGCEMNMLLAGFLGQPVIPVGHHEDVAGGLDLLSQLAGTLNSIGEVQWTDMKSIARSNFCTRRESEVLHVKMYSRKIFLKVPQGVNQLFIHRPWLSDGASEGLTLQTATCDPASFSEYRGESIRIDSCEEAEIHSIPINVMDPRTVPVSSAPLWTIVRRQVCESRDRLKPLFNRLRPKRQKPNQ